MMYARVVAASRAPHVDRTLYTVELCYWRAIHGELMTHRAFSRNAMSSRAIPVKTMLEQVREKPAMSIHWGANQPGMQARAEVDEEAKQKAIDIWYSAASQACIHAEGLMALGVHKQVANRLLEPFQWMRTIVTTTEWDNFYSLRCHPDAEPNFQALANEIRTVVGEAKITFLEYDQWHLPYIRDEERGIYKEEVLCKMSAARCARVSYLTHDGQTPSMEKDLALYETLAGSEPIHASPLEHQACVSLKYTAADGGLKGNFSRGWVQHRKLVERGVKF